MRGPGPKWHAKHTTSLVAAASAQRIVTLERSPSAKGVSPALAVWIAPTAAAALLGFVAVMVLA